MVVVVAGAPLQYGVESSRGEFNHKSGGGICTATWGGPSAQAAYKGSSSRLGQKGGVGTAVVQPMGLVSEREL